MASGSLDQAHAELILKFGDAPANGGDRHIQSTSSFGKAVRIHNGREDHQGIQIDHDCPDPGNLNLLLAASEKRYLRIILSSRKHVRRQLCQIVRAFDLVLVLFTLGLVVFATVARVGLEKTALSK